jgi:hypothetical protein
VLLIVFVLSFVDSAIRPSVDSFAVEFVFFPFTFVDSTIRPFILSFAFDIIIYPVTNINRLICPVISSLPPFSTVFEHSIVFGTIFKFLFARAVLHVIFPKALVPLAIGVNIYSESASSILKEFTGIDITVSMIKSSLALGHPVPPVPIVLGTILPELLTFSVFDVDFDLCFSIEDKLHLSSI